MALNDVLKLPDLYEIETELRQQLSGRPGHQRCVVGNGELLLILHEVPQPKIPEREAIFFWKRRDGQWQQPSGTGLSDLASLLDRYAKAIDIHEEVVDEADTAVEIFAILRHSGPLARSTRNLVQALEQVLLSDPDDRQMRGLLDRAREIERAADLLNNDAKVSLDFWRAMQAERHAQSSARLNRIAFRLNLLAGFFLPLVALGGIFGMNVDLPKFVQPLFWGILLSGLSVGGMLLWLVSRRSKDSDEAFADSDEEE